MMEGGKSENSENLLKQMRTSKQKESKTKQKPATTKKQNDKNARNLLAIKS